MADLPVVGQMVMVRRKHDKILQSVVILPPIDVMDNFISVGQVPRQKNKADSLAMRHLTIAEIVESGRSSQFPTDGSRVWCSGLRSRAGRATVPIPADGDRAVRD